MLLWWITASSNFLLLPEGQWSASIDTNSKSAGCVSRTVCQELNMSMWGLCRHTPGQTVLTEIGRDNRSPGISAPPAVSLQAALVGQPRPLKIMSQGSKDTEKGFPTGLVAHVSQCVNGYLLKDVSLSTQLPLDPDTEGLQPHCAIPYHLPVPFKL